MRNFESLTTEEKDNIVRLVMVHFSAKDIIETAIARIDIEDILEQFSKGYRDECRKSWENSRGRYELPTQTEMEETVEDKPPPDRPRKIVKTGLFE